MAECLDHFRTNQFRDLPRHGERSHSAQALRIRPEREANHQNTDNEEERLVFRLREGDFDSGEDEECSRHEHALRPVHGEFEIRHAGAQIDANGPHHANGVESRQGVKIVRDDKHEHRQTHGDGQRCERHPVGVQLGKTPRHISLARHHEKQPDQRGNRCVDSAQEEKRKNHAHHKSEQAPEPRPEVHRAVLLRHEPQHVFLPGQHFRSQRRRERKHGPAQKRGSHTNFNRYGNDGFRRCPADFWMTDHRTFVRLQSPREIRNRLDTAQRQNHANKGNPQVAEAFPRAGSLKHRNEMIGGQEARAQGNNGDDHRDRRQGESDSKTSAVPWSENIDDPDHDDGRDCGDHDVFLGHPEVAERRPSAERRRHCQIRHQQQRSDHGQKFAVLARRGIHASAIRKAAANHKIVQPDKGRECTNRDIDRQ